MKILLVLPAGKQVRVTRDNSSVPKRAMLRFSVLPMTMVAALTPKKHDVVICDENVEPLDFDTDADIVGISFMTAVANRAYEIARKFREKGKIVVAGGYHPTFCPDEVLEYFDSVIIGDAEILWPTFLADAESGNIKQSYRHDKLCDLAESPSPRNDLIDRNSRYYVTTNAVQTGRGCRHGCTYCSITAFHRQTYRHRPLDKVLEELTSIPRDFIFVDDNIVGDPVYARELFKAMIPLKKRWVSQCSIEIADDPELLELARSAGCKGLFIGIESINRKNLTDVDKAFNDPKHVVNRIKRIRSAGIGIIAGIIVGMDNDDVSCFERMLEFLQKTHIDAIQLNILTPLPGTPLFDVYQKKGRIIDLNWEHYDFRHCVIQPARMSVRELQAGADWLYSQFYRLDRILIRVLKSIPVIGLLPSLLSLKLNLTYRYDNIREGIIGWNPKKKKQSRLFTSWSHERKMPVM